jgi:hypothetical protein
MAEPIDAQIEQLLAASAPDVAATARALREVVREELPTITESVDFPDRLIAFGRSERMRDLLFAIIPHRAHVNLQLADGVDLPDPDGLIEGTGKRIRHVKVRATEAARSPALREIVRAQLAARPDAS